MKGLPAIGAVVLACAVLVAGCSWVDYFVVLNDTDEAVVLSYTVETPAKGFGLFGPPRVYRLHGSTSVDWAAAVESTDAAPGDEDVRVVLPAHTAAVIGRLDNQDYERHDQHFINDRAFNLVRLQVCRQRATKGKAACSAVVTPDTFDSVFSVHRGRVWMRVSHVLSAAPRP